MTRRLLACLAAVLALAGCGVGAGEESAGDRGVEIQVTRDFGARELGAAQDAGVPEGETVMRLLQRSFEVETAHGGGFVESIEGLSGGSEQGRRIDWFYYVNGIEASVGATGRELAPGDRIWWDRHDWSAAQRVPAVVGSWPEPFLSGEEGKRIPLALVCAGEERTCDEVERRLVDAGVEQISRTGIGVGAGRDILRIIIGPWDAVQREPTAALLARGPGASGVFARPGAGTIELLDEQGEVARVLRDGAGLVAATRFEDQQPTWFVTGTDDAGVASAATALREDVLRQTFAVAMEEGVAVPLPVRPQP